MHFLCVTQPSSAIIYGQKYRLKPLDPHLENIDDILVTDNTSASELISRHPEFLAGLSVNIDKLKGFPKIVNKISDIGPEGSVLIMRNGGIGDHIMFLPVLSILRDIFPSNVEIILSAQKEKHPLFQYNRCIKQLLTSISMGRRYLRSSWISLRSAVNTQHLVLILNRSWP